jgi:hypothetical protein
MQFIFYLFFFSWLTYCSWRTNANLLIQQTCEWNAGFRSFSCVNFLNLVIFSFGPLYRWVSLRTIKRLFDTNRLKLQMPPISKVQFLIISPAFYCSLIENELKGLLLPEGWLWSNSSTRNRCWTGSTGIFIIVYASLSHLHVCSSVFMFFFCIKQDYRSNLRL